MQGSSEPKLNEESRRKLLLTVCRNQCFCKVQYYHIIISKIQVSSFITKHARIVMNIQWNLMVVLRMQSVDRWFWTWQVIARSHRCVYIILGGCAVSLNRITNYHTLTQIYQVIILLKKPPTCTDLQDAQLFVHKGPEVHHLDPLSRTSVDGTIYWFLLYIYWILDNRGTRGCHTSFLPFSEVGECWSGTLSLNGGGSILGEWKP